MESLRDKLLGIIAGSLPETPEIEKFCEEKFSDMLDEVMDTITDHICEALSDLVK